MWEIPAAIGGLQTLGGIIGLIGSKKPKGYEVTPELAQARQRAEQMANTGYSASEIADYMGRLTNLNAQKYSLATSRGGGLNQYINAGIGYGNVNALNSFAAANSQKRDANRRYADSFANQYQSIANQNTGLNWQNYNREQQAFGGAMQAGINNIGLGSMMMDNKKNDFVPQGSELTKMDSQPYQTIMNRNSELGLASNPFDDNGVPYNKRFRMGLAPYNKY